MDEVPQIGGFSSKEQGFARPQSAFLTRKGDQLHRFARKEIEGARPPEPSDFVVERHSGRPAAAALATSL